MARRKKPKQPVSLNWDSFLAKDEDETGEEEKPSYGLNWDSFLEDTEEDEGYPFDSDYRVPGRKGLGPAVEPKAPADEDSSFQLPSYIPAEARAVGFGMELGRGIQTPEGRAALGDHVGGTYGMKGAASDIERLYGLEKYRTEGQRRAALSTLQGSNYGLGPGDGRIIADVNYAREMFSEPGKYEAALKEAYDRYDREAEQVGRAEKYYDESGNLALRTVGDVASNAESGISLLGGAAGGAFGGVPGAVIGSMPGSVLMADVAYDMSFVEAIRAGVPEEEARQFAGAMASSEFVLEALGGAVGGKLATTKLRGEIKKQIAARFSKYLPEVNRRLAGTAGRVAAGTATGYAEEAGTEALQMGISSAYQDLRDNSPEFQKFLREQAPRNPDGSINISEALSQFNRAGLAGAVMGGGITAGVSTLDNVVETQKKVATRELNNTIFVAEAKARAARAINAAAEVSDQQLREAGATPIEAPPTPPAQPDYLSTDPNEIIRTQYEEAGGTMSDKMPANTPTVPATVAQQGATIAAEKPAGPATPLTAKQRGEETDKARKAKLGELHKIKRDMGFSDEEYRATLATNTGKNSAKDMTLQELDIAISALKKSTPAPVEAVTPEPAENDIQVDDVLSKIRGLKNKEAAKKSLDSTTPPVKKGGLTVRDVIKRIVKAGKADTEAISDLINNGKVLVVQNESELPTNLLKGRDGWYDENSQAVWLVADNLNPDTLRGTALHEINHFLNLNREKGKPKATGISTLIGEDLDGYNARIRALAKSGNKVAQAAVARADKAALNAPEDQREFVRQQELTSYFASEALKPKGVLGAAAGIVRDIKSAINATARNKGIGELSANDISYILRRQAEEAKLTEFRSDGSPALDADSIIGERADTFEETRQRFPEREYTATGDGRKRIEISDRKAAIQPRGVAKLKEGKSVFLGELLSHDELFRAYNQRFSGDGGQFFSALKAVPVEISQDYADGAGYFLQDDKIQVGYEAVNDPDLLGNLLHEVQHAVQNREGFDRGTSVDYEYQQILRDFEKKNGREPYLEETEDLYKQAWVAYNRNYGEAEARLAERNFAMTEEELSANPPETRFTERGTVTTPTGELMVAERKLDPRNTISRRNPRVAKEYLARNQLDSIKAERGGNFDPVFVVQISGDLASARMSVLGEHFARMMKGYLNKWAGTENDPLRTIDQRLWAEEIDKAITPITKAKLVRILDEIEIIKYKIDKWYEGIMNPNIPDDALVWGGATTVYNYSSEDFVNTELYDAVVAARIIEEYLSHVKDYLLTVDPAKLQQYDLVRAVKETVKWDEKMRKEAEKARVKADAQLSTYIQFPDGYRWVRLNRPGQFAAESDIMGHSVRGYEPASDRRDIGAGAMARIGQPHPDWIPGAEGGHEAYGYGGWEAIKNDVARIYSLRDPSGKSVVTVEIGKSLHAADLRESVNEMYDSEKPLPERSGKFEVNQIKGRYNQAPPADTHPKTQDLLRNLNEEGVLDTTAEIGDWLNTGLDHADDFYLDGVAYQDALVKWLDDGENGPRPTLDDFNIFKTPPTVRATRSLDSVADRAKLGEEGVGRFDELLDTLANVAKLGFDPNRGIGKRALETIDYWKLKSGGMRELGEGYVVRINNAIKVAEENGTFTQQQFQDAINKAEAQPDPVSRDRAYDALVRNFGEAGREYRNGRHLIDQMTTELLTGFADEIEKTGRKPSQQELAIMNKMVESIGQYTHRVYLLAIPATQKQWARGLIRAYDKGQSGDKYFDVVQKAIDYIIEHELAIPPNARALAHKKEPTIRRMYQTWIGNAENLTKDEMIARLMAMREDITPERANQMALRIVKDILTPNKQTTATAKYYRGAAMDRTIITAREKVPAEIRALMGEITDPSQRLLVTLSAQAELLYRHRLLNDLYDNGRGELWVTPADRADPANKDFTELLQGEALGPLNGMYATKEFAHNIKATRATLTSFTDAVALAGVDASILGTTIGGAILRGAGNISGWQKVSKTVGDTGAWALNAAGSFLNLTKNGQLLGGKHSREAIADAIAIALGGHKGDEVSNKRLAVLLEHGLPDSVFTSELRDVEREFLQDLLAELNKDALAPIDKVWAKVRKKYRKVRDIYGLMDSWVKIADFYGQQEYLTKYYEANGDTVSQEDINREAADIVKFRNITYSRAPTVVRGAERSGGTVFFTYASEVVRTMVTTPLTVKMALQKAQAAKTPEARKIAMAEASRVTIGYAVAVGMIPAVTHAILAANFGEDEEERDRFLELGFPEDKDQSYTYVGKDKDGKVVLFNASRIDPNGHITDFVRLAATNSEPEEYWKNFVALFTSPLGNGYAGDLWDLATRSGGKESNLSRTFPATTEQLANLFEATGLERQDAERTMRLVDNWWPGAGRILDQETGKVVEPDDDATKVVNAAMRATGMRMTIIDPVKAAAREGYAYNRARGEATKRWSELMAREDLSEADILRTLGRIRSDELAASRRLAEVYSALDTSIAGVNPRQVLKDAKVSPEDINDAALGRFRSVVLSPSRIDKKQREAEKAAKTSEERKRIRQNYAAARKLIRELNMETR